MATGCVGMSKYKAVPNPADLKVSFADPVWDSRRVPDGQQCARDGGKGGTPRITVASLPSGTNAIVMEFSDASVTAMDNGGHGILGYRIPENSKRVTIPVCPGNTFDLPEGFFSLSPHANPAWDIAGAYLPPCSGGRGNSYYVTVKAVYDAPKGKPSKMLGKAVLQMGSY